MKFYAEGKEVELRGIVGKLGKIISSNGMTKLLKKEQRGVIAQLCSLDVFTSKSSISPDLQKVLDNHSKVFETPKDLPPIRDHDHAIHLILGSVPPNIRLYRYPYAQKSEIERMVAEMLEAGIIQPSQNYFSALVVLVHKKDGSWCMCPDYRELNKLTIKDKFHIPVIDELLDELRGSIYFTKLDLHLRYHQIRMKIEDIPKTTSRTHEGHYEFLVMPFGLTNAPSTFQGNGIGVVLMQDERPIAFESHPIKGKFLQKAMCEKEMLAILNSLKKWRPYLMARHFKVKIDHDSLKYFLEQRLSSKEKQKWVTKMLAYDFEIIYKKGKKNVVANALKKG
eukprot:PITA_22192